MFLALATDHFADRTGEEKPNPSLEAVFLMSAAERISGPTDQIEVVCHYLLVSI